MHRRITATMGELPYKYELVFVDDGSTDESFDVMAELHRSDDRVRVIRLRRNFGKAAAYSAGFEHARGDVVITMDTDLQDDPQEIPLLIEKIDEGYDLVSGWKHKGKGPWNKSIPSKVFNTVTRFITGLPLHDFNCPLKAYRKEVLAEIKLY
ncbi:MAG: glycosyltransferase family 2 protein, partial [Vicinamibacterales bacterium]